MPRQTKPPLAQKSSLRDDSLLLRSAESLGRMIGALQRQLDSASHRMSSIDDGERKTVAAKRPARGGKATRTTASTKRKRVSAAKPKRQSAVKRKTTGGSR